MSLICEVETQPTYATVLNHGARILPHLLLTGQRSFQMPFCCCFPGLIRWFTGLGQAGSSHPTHNGGPGVCTLCIAVITILTAECGIGQVIVTIVLSRSK